MKVTTASLIRASAVGTDAASAATTSDLGISRAIITIWPFRGLCSSAEAQENGGHNLRFSVRRLFLRHISLPAMTFILADIRLEGPIGFSY